jgi:tRNA threonylcarbamoyl adenosine modification protein (Sua5/YciO/YrdC/YwlC family)
MNEYIKVNAARPKEAQLATILHCLQGGGVIAYPTDSGYALGCMMGKKRALKRIQDIRALDAHHNFTLICRDLSEISHYAHVDNASYRLLKRLTPGAFTFILKASKEVPKLMQAKRKTIGIRISDHLIPLAITASLGQPLTSTTLMLPGKTDALVYPEDVSEAIGQQVDIIIDSGYCGFLPTTVVDLSEDSPLILREGAGDISTLI